MSPPTRREALLAAAASVAACAGPVAPSATVPTGSAVPVSGESQAFRPSAAGGQGRLQFADAPEWFRRIPALWVPTAESAGAGPIMFSDENKHALSRRIDSFARLPELLDSAQSLGTDAIHLVDWYEGAPGQDPAVYWLNKGDYLPRRDLGGEAAFRKGLAAVRARGGRVVLYVEGFILAATSEVGKAHGEAWSIRGKGGRPIDEPYRGNWKVCPMVEGFVAHLESVARRVAGYGASGIFLDSYGFQQDWVCTAKGHGHPPGDNDAFNRGAIAVTRRVRDALRSVEPEAVVICEGPRFERLLPEVDGTFDWGIHRITERPIWNCQGETDTFSIGYSLDDVHQLVAVGAKLALTQAFLERPHGASAAAALAERRARRRMPPDPELRHYWAAQLFILVHQWRNAAIVAGIPVPGIDDVTPRRGQRAKLFEDPGRVEGLMDQLATRAAELDRAIGRRAHTLGAATEHVASLCRARAALSPQIDDGATMASVETGQPSVPAWSFTSPRGKAFTAVNVSNDAVRVTLPAGGIWTDVLGGQTVSGRGVAVPGHGVRLLHQG